MRMQVFFLSILLLLTAGCNRSEEKNFETEKRHIAENNLVSNEESRFRIVDYEPPYYYRVDVNDTARRLEATTMLDQKTGCKYLLIREGYSTPSYSDSGGFTPLLGENGLPDCSGTKNEQAKIG